jgi:hypothetical protein
LGDEAPVGSSGELALFDDREKVLELANLHH